MPKLEINKTSKSKMLENLKTLGNPLRHIFKKKWELKNVSGNGNKKCVVDLQEV